MESREFTEDEVRAQLLTHIAGMVKYWASETMVENQTTEQRLDGLAFSILAALDGTSMNIPKFIVAPDPHPDDRQFHIDEGTNYFPENHQLADQIKCDLACSLHELY